MNREELRDPSHLAPALVSRVLSACDPGPALRRNWRDPGAGPITLIAAGKASTGMVRAACGLVPGVRGAAVCVPERTGDLRDVGVRILPADHPLPTERNVAAAATIADLARRAGTGDVVLVLLSGGASAHLTLPAPGLTLTDLRAVTGALLRAGAAIDDLNCVRKHCEQLKGGRLAALAHPARVVTYALSDVIGDRRDVIGSGPTWPDPTTYADALGVLHRFHAVAAAPRLAAHLESGARGQLPETPDELGLAREYHTIGSNRDAVSAAAAAAESLGFRVLGREDAVQGEAASVGRELAGKLDRLRMTPGAVPCCWIIGGETTVRLAEGESGSGGPCQELALAAAIELAGREHVAIITFATDGVDGPTDAAGAWVTGRTVSEAASRGLDAGTCLLRHDSSRVHASLGARIVTGPTGTNVNDVAVLFAW